MVNIQRLWIYLICVVSFSLYYAPVGFCTTEINAQNKEDNEKKSSKIKIYSDLGTGGVCLKLKIRDIATNQRVNIIVENYEFAAFLAIQKGLKTDKSYRFVDYPAFHKFVKEEYVDWMLKNEGKILDIDLAAFDKYITESLGSNFSVMKTLAFENPYTFQQLETENEQELVEKYFDYDSKSCFGQFKQKNWNKQNQKKLSYPAFIATFIDLGYIVGREDFSGNLYIKKNPCPASTTTYP